MPKYKNSFTAPTNLGIKILDEKNETFGQIRIKPSTILWKAKGKHSWVSVPLDDFVAWISTHANAKKVSK